MNCFEGALGGATIFTAAAFDSTRGGNLSTAASTFCPRRGIGFLAVCGRLGRDGARVATALAGVALVVAFALALGFKDLTGFRAAAWRSLRVCAYCFSLDWVCLP